MSPSPLPSIPAPFTARKQRILSALSVPDESYTDLSPKGSVDAGLKDLISEINAIDGLVTTSSCAGRISVFLEGKKGSQSADEEVDDGVNGGEKAVPGGKGMGGKWLFVSHDPVEVPENVHELFGLEEGTNGGDGGGRLVRFQFEPMILHIQTATLQHAQPLLAAALNAGFRESGVQSLKALDDLHASPMVAIRTAGLGLSSVVGMAADSADSEPRSLVSEEYLRMMLRLGNERFTENTTRIERFRTELGRMMGTDGADEGNGKEEWEDAKVRAERMKREGLARREELKREKDGRQVEGKEMELGGQLFGPD